MAWKNPCPGLRQEQKCGMVKPVNGIYNNNNNNKFFIYRGLHSQLITNLPCGPH